MPSNKEDYQQLLLQGVTATIYTQIISKALQLDAKKHPQQYPAVQLKVLKNAHDRFLVIDEKHLYHIGTSLKDLEKNGLPFLRWTTWRPLF